MAKFAFIFLFRQRYIHEDIAFTYRANALLESVTPQMKLNQTSLMYS